MCIPIDLQKLFSLDDDETVPFNSFAIIDVLANDSFIDGLNTPNNITIVDLLFTGENGVCSISEDGMTITYKANLNFFGSDQCVYIACN